MVAKLSRQLHLVKDEASLPTLASTEKDITGYYSPNDLITGVPGRQSRPFYSMRSRDHCTAMIPLRSCTLNLSSEQLTDK